MLIKHINNEFVEKIEYVLKMCNIETLISCFWMLSNLLYSGEDMREMFFKTNIMNEIIEILVATKDNPLIDEILSCLKLFLRMENEKNIVHANMYLC